MNRLLLEQSYNSYIPQAGITLRQPCTQNLEVSNINFCPFLRID